MSRLQHCVCVEVLPSVIGISVPQLRPYRRLSGVDVAVHWANIPRRFNSDPFIIARSHKELRVNDEG